MSFALALSLSLLLSRRFTFVAVRLYYTREARTKTQSIDRNSHLLGVSLCVPFACSVMSTSMIRGFQ